MFYVFNNHTISTKLTALLVCCSLAISLLAPFVASATVSTTTAVSEADATIETGIAQSGTTLTNNLNENVVKTATSSEPVATSSDQALAVPTFETATTSTSSVPELETASATSTAASSSVPLTTHDEVSSTTVAITNHATTTNTATTSAQSGNNTVTGGGTITSGDTVAYVDVVNVVNTNIVNSNGLMDFIHNTLGYRNVDLRNDFITTFTATQNAASTPPCSANLCNQTGAINATNTATITNDISVRADSGSNTISGDGTITTGNAYASANIINVANTNIVDSNYMLLVFNNFNDLTGDIVLPNSSFFDNVFSGTTGQTSSLTTSNQASTNNAVDVNASTGNNSTEGGTIHTGTSVATAQVLNQLNGNYLNTGSFSMLIRVHGEWSGDIYGLPDGMSWEKTSDGVRIYSTGGSTSAQGATHTFNNQANITNNVSVYALTGNNQVNGNDGTVTTGNAVADANIINIANTNVVSSNWSNLIFSVYGNWNGNLSFGATDLWLGVQAEADSKPIMPGDSVRYTYTVFNRGDTVARGVRLAAQTEKQSLQFLTGETDSAVPYTRHWSIPDLAPGQTHEFTAMATVHKDIRDDVVSAIPLQATVETSSYDADPSNNTDDIVIHVGEKDSSGPNYNLRFPAKLSITKTASAVSANIGDTIEYTISIHNRGGQLYEALLVDTLRDSSGTILNEQTWPLQTIRNDDTITITYSIMLDGAIDNTTLTNTAQVVGFHGSTKKKYQFAYESDIAEHTLTVGEPVGRVLGASTTCSPYLTNYLRSGSSNNADEVLRLNVFLQAFVDAELEVTNQFTAATERAVRIFQTEHASAVLEPWGISAATGYVYYTTQKKINEIMCSETTEFPLSAVQRQEIAWYRSQNV